MSTSTADPLAKAAERHIDRQRTTVVSIPIRHVAGYEKEMLSQAEEEITLGKKGYKANLSRV